MLLGNFLTNFRTFPTSPLQFHFSTNHFSIPAHKRDFEQKRRKHYDEGSALRRARELLAHDEEEES